MALPVAGTVVLDRNGEPRDPSTPVGDDLVRQRRGPEKRGEDRKIAHEAFGRDLFLQVVVDVGTE
jgi:hypothetical protein